MISLFAKPYRTVPDNYMQTLTFGKEIELLDIDEEKSGFSTFNVCNIASSEYPGDSDGLYILINGKEKLRLEDTFFWDGELNLISVEGKKFIMIKTVQSSEDTTTYIYQIFEDGRVGYDSGDVEVDEYSDSELTPLKTVYGEGEWDFDYTDKVVYNPMNAKITFRYDVIGTNFVIASVHFDGDELRFVPNSPFYDFTFRGPLTLKKEFKAGMIDPELMFNDDESITGEMDMEVELKPGDVIYLEKCRADQDQIFFSAENGEWGTFVMDSDSFLTINGEDAYEIFDGIILAD